MEKKKKEFDAVEWVRQIRAENYKKYGHLPMNEFLLALEKNALEARAERTRLKESQATPKHHE